MRDIFEDFEFPSEKEINENTRRLRISLTSRALFDHDPEFRKNKQQGAKKTADIRRKIPVEDYEGIIREYYDPTVKRKHGFVNVIAQRYSDDTGYGSKLTGQITKVLMNYYNTLPEEEYAQLRDAWEQANPDFRSEMLKDLYKTGKRKPTGLQNSIASDSVDAATAGKIYADCLTKKDSRTNKNYQRLAKKYAVPTWQKVRDVANGHHYSLRGRNVEQDIEQWRLNIGEGNYEMIDTQGNSHMFNDLRELGYFLNTRWGNDTSDETKNWYTGRNWFEKCQPNVWYTKQRREFKGWSYCNHLPAK